MEEIQIQASNNMLLPLRRPAMEEFEIHNSDNTRLELRAVFNGPSQPPQISKIRLHIHRTNFVCPTLRLSYENPNFSITAPLSPLPLTRHLEEERLNRVVSNLISAVIPMYRRSVQSVKRLICSFVRKVFYRSGDFPNGTVMITTHLWVSTFNGLSLQEDLDGGVLVLSEAPVKMKCRGGKRDENCAICLEDFVPGVEIKKTICRHVFHGRCLDEWMARKHSCPLCRFRL